MLNSYTLCAQSVRKNIWWPCKVTGLQCRHPYDPYIYSVEPYMSSGKAATVAACEVTAVIIINSTTNSSEDDEALGMDGTRGSCYSHGIVQEWESN